MSKEPEHNPAADIVTLIGWLTAVAGLVAAVFFYFLMPGRHDRVAKNSSSSKVNSCQDVSNDQPPQKIVIGEIPNIRVITIDGCEYLYGRLGGGADSVILTHKGNCRNHNPEPIGR